MCDDSTMGGKSGCCCCHGPQGPQGIPGLQGPQGIQGQSGFDGAIGPQGPIGPQGTSGPVGLQGPPGQQGPQGFSGQNGLPGPAGSQGPAGAAGLNGAQGLPGLQGPQGITGAQGPQGIQGIPGKDCEDRGDCCCEIYGNLYASLPQVIGPYSSATDTVLFDKQNAVSGQGAAPSPPQTIMTIASSAAAAAAASAAVLSFGGTPVSAAAASAAVLAQVGNTFLAGAQAASAAVLGSLGTITQANAAASAVLLVASSQPVVSADFDLSMMAINGEIKFLKSAVYHIFWQLQARITPPVPNPVPSWSFGFWLDGVLVPGSIYSGFTQAPGDDACHSTGDLQIQVDAGQVLKLKNTSVSSVNLNPNITGAVFPITIASITISCLKKLP